jgi:hypothetical protein
MSSLLTIIYLLSTKITHLSTYLPTYIYLPIIYLFTYISSTYIPTYNLH